MEDNVFDALCKYFKSLSLYGYKSYRDVQSLLVLIAIEEIMDGYFSNFVTEEDYKVLNNTLSCLYGTSCIIPYPEFKLKENSLSTFNNNPVRVSEDDLARISEDRLLRLVNL